MNINCLKQKRTKISGIAAIFLLIAAIALMFIDFLTDSKIDSGTEGLLCLIISFIFAIIGIVKGNKESLGYTLCFPSIVIGGVFSILFALAGLVSNQSMADENHQNSNSDKTDFELCDVIATDYMYQYIGRWTESTGGRKFSVNESSALFALCEAYGFFERDPAFLEGRLMALLKVFPYTTKEDYIYETPFYTVTEYFQSCEYNIFKFWDGFICDDDLYTIIIEDKDQERKVFELDGKTGFVRYEGTSSENRKTYNKELERQIAFNYYICLYAQMYHQLEYEKMWRDEIWEPDIRAEADNLGKDYGSLLSAIKEDDAWTEMAFYRRMKKTFDTCYPSKFSEYHISLFCNCLYKKIMRSSL